MGFLVDMGGVFKIGDVVDLVVFLVFFEIG